MSYRHNLLVVLCSEPAILGILYATEATVNKNSFKVVIITNLEQKQKSALNAENTTDLPKTLQVPSLCCFSQFKIP